MSSATGDRASLDERAMPTWHLGWKWYAANREFLAGRGESVVAALRDVLAVPEDQVRCWGWGENGPILTPYKLKHRDERPSRRGAAERCTDWEDLRRLDWVLQTLPTDSAVLITSPTRRTTTVQFMTHFRDDTIARRCGHSAASRRRSCGSSRSAMVLRRTPTTSARSWACGRSDATRTVRVPLMTRYEYATIPLLVHATKQILDQWGEDGWELVTVVPGPNPENLVAYLKREKA